MQPYSPPPGPVAATAKLSFNQWLRASPWWHKVLVLLPLVVVPIGGLIGGVCGGAMAVANQAILRSALGTAGIVGTVGTAGTAAAQAAPRSADAAPPLST